MGEMLAGIKRRNFLSLSFLLFFLCKVSSKYTPSSRWTWVNHLNRSALSFTEKPFECTFVNHSLSPALICCDIIKICIANIMKSDATNQIRYRKFLCRCIRKQTIKHSLLALQVSVLIQWKNFVNEQRTKIFLKIIKSENLSNLFDGRNNCAKKGSSIYALCNNNNKGII